MQSIGAGARRKVYSRSPHLRALRLALKIKGVVLKTGHGRRAQRATWVRHVVAVLSVEVSFHLLWVWLKVGVVKGHGLQRHV